ncbi:hypothetical protein G7Y89_g6369 [Cudoniella acicularis]|uniref:2EXR domain-containing protein n=1 Tax=Cudoniella acicularis TaxID=354080 RepID=A0A8H4RKK6_9HELO|nr:hypothetical protein G7Y89_g6369 [Cudoniella acicularis]
MSKPTLQELFRGLKFHSDGSWSPRDAPAEETSPPLEEPSISDIPNGSLTSFHLFPQLAPEIRAKIWALLLPLPRILLVKPDIKTASIRKLNPWLSEPDHFQGEGGTYAASPISYGGSHPVLLSVCRESRGEALNHLTLKFKAFWNLKTDVLYVQANRFGEDNALKMLEDMRKQGLLDDFKKLAADWRITSAKGPDNIITSLRLLRNVSNLYFILRNSDYLADVLDPGVSWSLMEVNSPDQKEFPNEQAWCRLVHDLRDQLEGRVKRDCEDFPEEWKARKVAQPVIEVRVIKDRMLRPEPTTCEPLGMDFFG